MKNLLEKEDSRLREQAALVPESEFNSAWLTVLAADMLAIMQEKGAIGVAAPQIGISKRVIVFGTSYTKRRKPEVHIPDTVLINPTLTVLSTEKTSEYEGCLNCGMLMGQVPRAVHIEYSGYDLQGNFICKQVSGLEARILQHEIDHLDGVLFLDRIEDPSTLTTYDELQKRHSPNEK
ncbi:MAG: peptide deformylase [Legionellaceae bacterium]|nr:peptide deformylase [Legionellaceae bacterium]